MNFFLRLQDPQLDEVEVVAILGPDYKKPSVSPESTTADSRESTPLASPTEDCIKTKICDPFVIVLVFNLDQLETSTASRNCRKQRRTR